MKTVSKILAGTVAAAAIAGSAAAPAAAQYYPGGGSGNVIVGAVLDSILRGNLGGYNGYGGQGTYGPYGSYNGGYGMQNDRYLIDQCARASEQRVNGNGYTNQYGGNFRVAQVDRVERTAKGNFRVYGAIAGGGYQGNYGGYYNSNGGYSQPYGGYNQGGYAGAPQYRFNCKINYRGQITDLKINRWTSAYRY